MRKIYSILLIACSLLISVNSWAQIKTVRLEKAGQEPVMCSSLQAAVNAINAGETAKIVLEYYQELSAPVVIPQVGTSKTDTVAAANKVANRPMQHITLDMNGYDIYASESYFGSMFILLKGDLNIIGEGTISRNDADTTKWAGDWVNFSKAAIVVCGADGERNPTADKPDRSKQEWSVLTIGEKVTVAGLGHGLDNKNNKVGCYGLAIQDITTTTGNGTYYTSLDKYVHYVNLGYSTYNKTSDVGPMWFRAGSPGEQGSAFGVKIIIKGTVKGYQRGINIVGHINQQPDSAKNSPYYTGETKPRGAEYPFYTHYYPYIKIEKGAKVYNTETGIADDGNGGIYGAGWCIIDISGEVYGQTGLLLKGGDILVYDGTVYSTSTTGAANGNYKGTVSGNAIFITTDPKYAGNTGVTIDGDSKITGNGGTAITDVLASNTTEPKVEHITINGGTIEGGNNGAIAVTDKTGDHTTIYGGSIEGDVKKDNNPIPTTDITAQGTHTTTVTVGGKTTIVVSTGAAPKELPNVYNTPVMDSVKWTGTAETLAGNLTLKELEINQTYDQVLTVPNGVTLNVEHLVMGENAKIIVNAGGKLVVTGTQGIVAPVTSNIVLKANADAQATFVISPEVTSNKQPNATVELYTDCYQVDANTWKWQRFATPMTQTPTPTKSEATPTGVKYIDDATQVWTSINAWSELKPFMAAAITNNTNAGGVTYTFAGKLMGNVTDDLKRKACKWNYYGNSFMAPMSTATVLNVLGAQSMDAVIYYWDFDIQGYNFVNAAILEDWGLGLQSIPALGFFVLKNNAAQEGALNIDYDNSIYNYNVNGGSPAPQRIAANNANRVRIKVTAENGASDVVYVLGSDKYTAEYENGADAEKFMNEGLNLYVQGDMNYAMLATDEILGTTISMKANEAINYTMTFGKVNGEYALRDNMTGKTIAIVEGATYNFSAQPNEVAENRFEIVNRDAVTTDINTIVGDANASKAVYTVLGQYVGETANWNMLPAGIYVVDGVKVVK